MHFCNITINQQQLLTTFFAITLPLQRLLAIFIQIIIWPVLIHILSKVSIHVPAKKRSCFSSRFLKRNIFTNYYNFSASIANFREIVTMHKSNLFIAGKVLPSHLICNIVNMHKIREPMRRMFSARLIFDVRLKLWCDSHTRWTDRLLVIISSANMCIKSKLWIRWLLAKSF